MGTLFVIDSSVIGPEYIVKSGEEMGLDIVFLTNLSRQEGDALSQLTSCNFINCNTESFDELFAIISSFPREEVAGVITFLDSKLEICSKLCHALKIKGVDPTIGLLKDKAYVDSVIPEFTPTSISFNVSSIPYLEIKKMLTHSKHGLILKPSFAAGARGIRLIQQEKEVDQIETLFDPTLSKHLHPDEYVIQEVIKGELISLEGYVLDGRVTPIGITGRRKIKDAESIFIFPYETTVSQSMLTDVVQTLVNKSGYKNGFFHTEFIASEDTAKLIDCNFGRPGGANITEIIACAYDLAPHSIYLQAMELVLNNKERIPSKFWMKKGWESVGIAYGIPTEDKVLEIICGEYMKSKHTRAQNLGDQVSPMGSSNWSWLGMLSGKSEDVFHDIEKIKIRTLNSGWVKPVYYNKGIEGAMEYLEK
ncbi:ATP-grasp domain-containing protein [Bacillus toyonensis]|uniref:ATP-grasp domain-containing protein n=1 Tax=Bacillus toyonensis TaxID=155322 RepID=UPI003465D33D